MSASYGPTIVRENLVYFVDFANTKCYPGTGSSTIDLIATAPGQIISATFSVSNFGTFDLDGANSYLLNSTTLAPHFSSNTTVSLFAWIYPTSAGQIVSELGQSQINAGWHDAQMQVTSGGNFLFGVWPHSGIITSPSTYPLNAWHHIGFTFAGGEEASSGSFTAYVDGVAISSNTTTRNAPYNNGSGLFYGLANSDNTFLSTGAQYMAGKYGMFFVYNRAITAEEVYRNHLAVKNRYGI